MSDAAGSILCVPVDQTYRDDLGRILREAAGKRKGCGRTGNAFGASGEGFVRISYAYSIDEIKGALERIAHFLETC